jgi:hypothetical protein
MMYQVSRLILGCASYGTKSDVAWRIEEEEALKHLRVRVGPTHMTCDHSLASARVGKGYQHL